MEKVYIIVRTAYNQFEDVHSGIVKTTDKAGNTHQVEFDPLRPGAEDEALQILVDHLNKVNA